MFAIEFRFPELRNALYAGLTAGAVPAAGFAPTLATAQTFETEDAARTALENCYGRETATFGYVVPLEPV